MTLQNDLTLRLCEDQDCLTYMYTPPQGFPDESVMSEIAHLELSSSFPQKREKGEKKSVLTPAIAF